ncbi:MAG: translocation/assembly module TamB domain-containing protein [Nannocystis sp.]|nr:translocation/assembly module TamB domain-containing protein [Nannocystis sp.]
MARSVAHEPEDRARWQAEADLLADGRDHLERLTDSLRYRDLYPAGPNLALLLAAYQDLWRLRRVGQISPHSPARRQRRALKRLLRARFRRDTVDRARRVAYGYPVANPHVPIAGLPPLVERALAAVDPDARELLLEHIHGARPDLQPSASATGVGPAPARLARGLDQLRRALINEALAAPDEIPGLPAAALRFAISRLPTRRRHPIATLLLVKLPLYLWFGLLLLFNIAYFGAWLFFNDEVLGGFLGPTISGFIDGDLEFESIHWQPRLIIDLITGTPTPVHVEGFRIYEGYKYLGQPRRRVTVHAEAVDVEMVLHEIIPLNRLGVPPVFEIPWYLHFTRARADAPVRVWAREYAVERRDGEIDWRLSLPGAFMPPDDEPGPPDIRGISIRVDDAEFTDLTLELDMRSRSRWHGLLHMTRAHAAVHLEGEHPKEPPRPRLPLEFALRAEIDVGQLDILSLGDDGYRIPIRDMVLADLRSGDDEIPLGDLIMRGDARFAGSPVAIDTLLTDFLSDDPIVDMTMLFSDAHGIAGLAVASHGLPPSMVEAVGAPAQLTVRGPLSDPAISLAAQGLTINPDEAHPDWTLDDAELSVTLQRDPIGAPWADRFPEGAERWQAEIERFSAAFLDGGIKLRPHGIPTRIVLPEGDDGPNFLITSHLTLEGVDPALLADDPAAAKTFAGALTGDLGLPALIIDFSEGIDVTRLDLDLEALALRRDHGPAQDSLPRQIRADGGLLYDTSDGLEIDALRVAVDGGHVTIDGGVDETARLLRPTRVALEIDDGAAFLAGFAMPAYFDRLDAGLTLTGPLSGPSGAEGHLSVGGVGRGDVIVTGMDNARLWMDRGELHVRSPDLAVLGGRGRVSADVGLFRGGELTSDPNLRASLDLSGAELGRLTGGTIRGAADLQLEVSDAAGAARPLSRAQARGALYVDRLGIGGAELRRAEARFDLDPERLTVAALHLPYDRKVSPYHDPTVTIPAGELSGSGTVRFTEDPELDLQISAWGIPLDLFARAIEYPDFPFGGELRAGSKVKIRGSVRRPSLEGVIQLGSLSAAGVPLGQGELALETADRPAGDRLAARREVRLQGRFRGRRPGEGADRLDWSMDGLVALGARPRRGSDSPAMNAEVTANIANLPIRNLIPKSSAEQLAGVEGQLEGLTIGASFCDPREDLLATCRDAPPADDLDLRVALELDRLWLRDRGDDPKAKRVGDPCADPSAICSVSPLAATLDGTNLVLARPWSLKSGGSTPRTLSIAGAFDLSAPPALPVEAQPERCAELARTAVDRAADATGARAELRGALALSALTAFVRPYGVRELRGHLGIDLDLRGPIGAPVVRGIIDIPTEVDPVSLRMAGQVPWRIGVPSLAVRIAGDHVFAAGALVVRDQRIEFGDFTRDGREATYYALSGPCAGGFQVAAQGALDGELLAEYVPDLFTRSGGSLEISRVLLAGETAPELKLTSFGLDLAPGPEGFRADLTLAEIEPIDLQRGEVAVLLCSDRDPCPEGQEGYAVLIGGRSGAAATAAPSTALRARIGDRGRLTAWGSLLLSPALDRLDESALRVALDEVNYRQFDNSGRPELLATLSSEELTLTGRGSLVLRGEVLIERSRWIRDAQQGVRVLSFADPSTAPESPPPALLQDLALDLRMRTIAPFRVDNNVMKGVEGQVALTIGGTFSDLDLAGRIDVGTGVLDLSILGSAFDIQYGKVTLDREIEASKVDVLALRQEPIYLDGQPRQMAVRLLGTLDAINLRCTVQGDTSTRQRTTRECVDYLVLGAGTPEVTGQSGVRRTGGGGLLGKPIGLVGNLTEIKIDRYIEDSAPLIAPYVPDIGLRLGQYGIEVEAETPRPWFRSEWGNLSLGAGYTRGYPGLLLRNSYNWRVRFQILDNATLELRDSKRSYYNERIIFDPLRQRSLELRFDAQIPSLR